MPMEENGLKVTMGWQKFLTFLKIVSVSISSLQRCLSASHTVVAFEKNSSQTNIRFFHGTKTREKLFYFLNKFN